MTNGGERRIKLKKREDNKGKKGERENGIREKRNARRGKKRA